MNPILYIDPTEDNPAGIQFVPNDVIRSLHQDTPDSGLCSAGCTVMGPVMAFLTKNGTIPLPPGTEGEGVTYEPPMLHVANDIERYSGNYEVSDVIMQDDGITITNGDPTINGGYRRLVDLNEDKATFKFFSDPATDFYSHSIFWLSNLQGYGGPTAPGFGVFDENSSLIHYSLDDEETPDLCSSWFNFDGTPNTAMGVTAGMLIQYIGPSSDYGGVFVPVDPTLTSTNITAIYKVSGENDGKVALASMYGTNALRYGIVWMAELHTLVPAIASGTGGWVLIYSFAAVYYNLGATDTPPTSGWLRASNGAAEPSVVLREMTKGEISAGFIDANEVVRIIVAEPNTRQKYDDIAGVQPQIFWNKGTSHWEDMLSQLWNAGNEALAFEGSPAVASTMHDAASSDSWQPYEA